MNFSKNSTCPSGKLRTKTTSPIAKSTGPGLSDTTFFACWEVFLGFNLFLKLYIVFSAQSSYSHIYLANPAYIWGSSGTTIYYIYQEPGQPQAKVPFITWLRKTKKSLPTLTRRMSNFNSFNQQFLSFYVTKMNTVTNAQFYVQQHLRTRLNRNQLHYPVGIDLSIGKPYVPFEQLAPALLVNYLWSYPLRYGPEDQDDIAHSDSKPRILLLGLRRSACSIIHTNYNFYNSTCTVYNLVSCYSDDCIELQVIKLLTCPIIKYM